MAIYSIKATFGFNNSNLKNIAKTMKKSSLILLFLGLCGSITLEVSTSYNRGDFWLLKTQANGQKEIEWTMVLFISCQVFFPLFAMIFAPRLGDGIPANNYKLSWLRWLNKVNGFITLVLFSILGSALSFGTLTLDPLAGLFSGSVGLFFMLIGWLIGKKLTKNKTITPRT
jgi:hypothetical protein